MRVLKTLGAVSLLFLGTYAMDEEFKDELDRDEALAKRQDSDCWSTTRIDGRDTLDPLGDETESLLEEKSDVPFTAAGQKKAPSAESRSVNSSKKKSARGLNSEFLEAEATCPVKLSLISPTGGMHNPMNGDGFTGDVDMNSLDLRKVICDIQRKPLQPQRERKYSFSAPNDPSWPEFGVQDPNGNWRGYIRMKPQKMKPYQKARYGRTHPRTGQGHYTYKIENGIGQHVLIKLDNDDDNYRRVPKFNSEHCVAELPSETTRKHGGRLPAYIWDLHTQLNKPRLVIAAAHSKGRDLVYKGEYFKVKWNKELNGPETHETLTIPMKFKCRTDPIHPITLKLSCVFIRDFRYNDEPFTQLHTIELIIRKDSRPQVDDTTRVIESSGGWWLCGGGGPKKDDVVTVVGIDNDKVDVTKSDEEGRLTTYNDVPIKNLQLVQKSKRYTLWEATKGCRIPEQDQIIDLSKVAQHVDDFLNNYPLVH